MVAEDLSVIVNISHKVRKQWIGECHNVVHSESEVMYHDFTRNVCL